jgi:hypothetical protein
MSKVWMFCGICLAVVHGLDDIVPKEAHFISVGEGVEN